MDLFKIAVNTPPEIFDPSNMDLNAECVMFVDELCFVDDADICIPALLTELSTPHKILETWHCLSFETRR